MSNHNKKIYSRYFKEILSGAKTFELRLADWDCQPGDYLTLIEVDELTHKTTDRTIRKKVGIVRKTKEVDHWPREDVEKYGYQIISLLDEAAK